MVVDISNYICGDGAIYISHFIGFSSWTSWKRSDRINNMRSFSLFVVLVFSLLATGADAKWVEGTVDTSSSRWEFLTRFCFLSTHGTLEYDIRYPVGYGTQDILLYFDTPGQWDAVYDRGKSCEEKADVLSINSNQIISLNTSHTQTSAFSGCSLTQYNGDTWYNCVGKRAFKSMRERWWYIALARCGLPKDSVTGLYAQYKIHMTNGDDLLHQEYSADEFYIFPINIAFFILYVIITILSGICAVILRQRNLFHTTYKLFMFSIVTWAMSLLLKVVAWGHYGITGWEMEHVEVSGRVMQSFSQVAFILLLVLMAKGYTITRGSLTTASLVKITIFISFYFVTTCALFIWERLFFDPGKVLYYYESPPGYCMVALQLMAWCWFLYAAIFTLKHTDSKSLFYMPFFTFYTLWFWAGPIIIMVAMFAMAKWSREKTVNGVEQLVAFLGHAVFLALTRPSAANSNFPYHVRTSQIDTLKDDESNYHFNEKDAEHYVIKSGPDLNFFITGKSSSTTTKPARDDPDNVSTISCLREYDQKDIKRLEDVNSGPIVTARNVGLDLKNSWFDMMGQPPDYEEANSQGPKGFALRTFPQAPPITTDLPPLPPPPLPPPQEVREIPLALIVPTTTLPTMNQHGGVPTLDLDLDPDQIPIRPRLSIVSDPNLPRKVALPPVAPPTIPLNPLPENFPFSINSNQPPVPKFNFPNKNNSNSNKSSPLEMNMNRPAPNQTPSANFNIPSRNNTEDTSMMATTNQHQPPDKPTPADNFPLFKFNLSSPNKTRNRTTGSNAPQIIPPLLSASDSTLAAKPLAPIDRITPAHSLAPLEFTPPTPRSNKHTFSSTIALLTKTADATNIDDILSKEQEARNKKKGNKANKVIVSQTLEERERQMYKSDTNLDTASKNILAPVDQTSTPRMAPRARFPTDMPPLPPANHLVEKYSKG